MQNERTDVSDLEDKFKHGLVAGAAKPERVEANNVVAIFNRPDVDQDFIGFAVCKNKTQNMPGGQGEAWDVRMVNGGHSNRAVLPRHVRALNVVHFSALIRSHGYTSYTVGNNALNIEKDDGGGLRCESIDTVIIDDLLACADKEYTTSTEYERIDAPEIDDMLKCDEYEPICGDDVTKPSPETVINTITSIGGPCDAAEDVAFERALTSVADERLRQINEEGFTSEKDDKYTDHSLVKAAASYLICIFRTRYASSLRVPVIWPFNNSWWKPRSDRENLVRAGALIMAEIERLDRATIREGNE